MNNDYSDRPASPSMRALANWTPEPAPTVAPPVHVFDGVTVAPWLRALYDHPYLNGSPMLAVRAYGTAARLWTPPPGATAAMVIALLGNDCPLARFRAWFAALPENVLGYIDQMVVLTIERLSDDLDAIEIDTAASWLRDRDDLAAFSDALTALSPAYGVRHYLADVDAKARTHASLWQHPAVVAEIAADPRFGAVAWQEPESLVGDIAGYALHTTARSAR